MNAVFNRGRPKNSVLSEIEMAKPKHRRDRKKSRGQSPPGVDYRVQPFALKSPSCREEAKLTLISSGGHDSGERDKLIEERYMENNHSGSKDQNSSGAPMEQVREILFGAQLKDMEVRFKRQEERLLREIHDVKDSLKKRLDSLENFMKSEVGSLLERLKREQDERETVQRAEQKERAEALAAEQRERAEALKNEQRERSEALKAEERERQEAVAKLSGDLSTVNENFERRLAKLADTLDATERDLRSLLLGESGSLTDKIESKYADALSVVSKTAAQIRSDMVYRTALSGMFAEMVGNLSRPWNEEGLGFSDEDSSESNQYAYQQSADELNESEENSDDNDEGHLPQVVRVGSADNY